MTTPEFTKRKDRVIAPETLNRNLGRVFCISLYFYSPLKTLLELAAQKRLFFSPELLYHQRRSSLSLAQARITVVRPCAAL